MIVKIESALYSRDSVYSVKYPSSETEGDKVVFLRKSAHIDEYSEKGSLKVNQPIGGTVFFCIQLSDSFD